jgi:hypothetical protein
MYFPRLIVPTATVVVVFTDFLITFALLIVLMAWFDFWPDWRLLLPAGVHPAGFHGEHGSRSVDHRAQCKIPRFSLCDPVHRAVRPLRVAGRVRLERDPRGMAAGLVAQSDGRGHGRFSAVHSERPESALPAGLGGRFLSEVDRRPAKQQGPEAKGRRGLCRQAEEPGVSEVSEHAGHPYARTGGSTVSQIRLCPLGDNIDRPKLNSPWRRKMLVARPKKR